MTWQPSKVTLHDGREVLSDSEEYRHECEARYVLSLPTVAKRRQYLHGRTMDSGKLRGGVLGVRGEAEVKRLENTIWAIWQSRKKQQSGTA